MNEESPLCDVTIFCRDMYGSFCDVYTISYNVEPIHSSNSNAPVLNSARLMFFSTSFVLSSFVSCLY